MHCTGVGNWENDRPLICWLHCADWDLRKYTAGGDLEAISTNKGRWGTNWPVITSSDWWSLRECLSNFDWVFSSDWTEARARCRSNTHVFGQSMRRKVWSTSMAVPVLLPLRFFALVAHFVGLLTLIWSRAPVVTSCLDWDDGEPSSEEYSLADFEIIAAICISIACCFIEIIGFASGMSLLNSLQCLYSFLCHSLAIFFLVYVIYGRLSCSLLWWIVSVLSVTPAMCEVAIIIIYFSIKQQT